jgi:GNAT superfamily N-acetyltransferase
MRWFAHPSPDLLSLLFRLDAASVLTGPDRDPAEAVIDPVFEAPFASALADLRADAGLPGNGPDPVPPWVAGLARDGALIAASDEVRLLDATAPDGTGLGVLLVDTGSRAPNVIGLFTGPTLCVDPKLRGRGYGRALAMARLIRDEALPTWEHDRPGYSPAGAATVASALSALRRMAPEEGLNPSF